MLQDLTGAQFVTIALQSVVLPLASYAVYILRDVRERVAKINGQVNLVEKAQVRTDEWERAQDRITQQCQARFDKIEVQIRSRSRD